MKVEEIDIENSEYPEKLRKTKNAPKKLYILGNKKLLNTEAIAIVGSRDCTEEGKRNARMFSANIANAGFTVVSGMAKGIDREAHIGALEVCGNTIAVLGNGVDIAFPSENKEIYKQILKKGGLIISEYKSGTLPESEKFRQRNRIVSGLSLGVLVVEAEYRSGTSITVRYAKEEKRDVFCIPSSRENNKGLGTNMLIQKGAKLVLKPKEIIERYTEKKIKQISLEDLEKQRENTKINLEKIKKEYREIYKILEKELSINDISIKTKIEISKLYEILLMMEMEGLIESKQQKYKIKKG